MHIWPFFPLKKNKYLLQYVFLFDHETFYAALQDAESVQHSDEEEAEKDKLHLLNYSFL